MACGDHLGILLICLVQAEHVFCLWAKQAQTSLRQNSNTYVGLPQLASNYPQNQLRRTSAQISSSHTEPAASSSRFSQVYSTGGETNPSQPAQSGHSSVSRVQSSSAANNWRSANAQTVPKRFLGLSTAIASGSSLSKYDRRNDFTNDNKKTTWPVQQGTAHVGKYVSSSSASVQSPESPSTAQKAPSAAATSASYRSRSYDPVKYSSQFSVGAPAREEMPVQMQRSVTVRARRVSSHGSKASKPSRFSRPQNNPSQTRARNRDQSKLFQPTRGNAKGSQSLPASQTQNASGQRFAPTTTYDIPDHFGGFAIRRLKEPADQKVSVGKPQQSYPTSSWQSASLKQQQQTYPTSSWQSESLKQQQTYPTSSQQSASLKQQQSYPTSSQQSASLKQQQTYPTSSRQSASLKQQQTYPTSSWQSASLKQQQTYPTSSWQSASLKQQQTYPTSSWQSESLKQQTYPTSSQQSASLKLQQTYPTSSWQSESLKQQTYPTSWQSASLKLQQTYPAPPQRQQAYKPQVQSVHHESKWKRVKPAAKLSAADVTG